MPVRLFKNYPGPWPGRWGLLLLLGLVTTAAPAQKGWRPGFNTPGLNGWGGTPLVVAVHNRHRLIAAGSFTDAGGYLTADGAARWNGRTWRPLGRGPGIGPGSWVSAALCPPGGAVVLAVRTDGPAFSVTEFVTRWNGRHWQRLGPAFPAKVQALAVDAHGDLLVAVQAPPDFAARTSGVLRWDGQRWQPLGPNDPTDAQGGSTISQLLVLPTGDLVASGHFAAAAGQRISGAARWTGTTWQRLGPDVDQPALDFSLALDAQGELLNLHQGAVDRTTRWDGRAWQPLATGLMGRVADIRLVPLTQELRAIGRFTLPGDTTTRRVARWDGTHWQPAAPLPAALASLPNGTALAQLPSGEVLVDRGPGLSWWNGKTWQALASYRHTSGLAASTPECEEVQHVAVTPKGTLYLTSSYRDYQATGADDWHRLVERKKGRHVQTLGPPLAKEIVSLVVAPGGDVFAGVDDNQNWGSAHDSADYLTRWDGHRWQPLAAGPPGYETTPVVASNGDLVPSGPFGLARWDGWSWHLSGPAAIPAAFTHYRIWALAPNGGIIANGRLVCANGHRTIGVARWDGSSWQHLTNAGYPNTCDGTDWQLLFKRYHQTAYGYHEFQLNCLVVAPNGDLVAGGSCWDGGRRSSTHPSAKGYVARWNGTDWQAMGPELNGAVNALAVAANGDIIVGGDFIDAGAVGGEGGSPAADYVARWHNGAWQPLGAGLDDTVNSLVVAPNGDIVVGGKFTATNDGLAMWHLGIFRDR